MSAQGISAPYVEARLMETDGPDRALLSGAWHAHVSNHGNPLLDFNALTSRLNEVYAHGMGNVRRPEEGRATPRRAAAAALARCWPGRAHASAKCPTSVRRGAHLRDASGRQRARARQRFRRHGSQPRPRHVVPLSSRVFCDCAGSHPCARIGACAPVVVVDARLFWACWTPLS